MERIFDNHGFSSWSPIRAACREKLEAGDIAKKDEAVIDDLMFLSSGWIVSNQLDFSSSLRMEFVLFTRGICKAILVHGMPSRTARAIYRENKEFRNAVEARDETGARTALDKAKQLYRKWKLAQGQPIRPVTAVRPVKRAA